MKNKISFSLIFSIVFIDLLGFSIVIPILAPLFLDPSYSILPADFTFGVRTILLGFLLSSFPVAQFFGAPVLGAWSDRAGRKKVLLVSIAGTFLGHILFALGLVFGNIFLLFAARMLDGFTGGNISVLQSSIADLSKKEDKSKNFGLIGMAFGLGFIIGPYIGGVLSDPGVNAHFNFATPFWFAALLSFVNLFLVKLKFRETLVNKMRSELSLFTGFRNLRRAWVMVNMRVLFMVVFLLAFGFTFFTQFFQVFLVEKFDFSQSQIGEIFAFTGFWIALTQGLLNRFVARRFRPRQVLSVSIFVMAAAFPFLLLPGQAALLLFVLPFIAVANGITIPNQNALVSDSAGAESQGEIMGINQSINSLAFAAPPVIAGFFAAVHIYLPIAVAAFSIFCAWLVFVGFYLRRKPAQFHEV